MTFQLSNRRQCCLGFGNLDYGARGVHRLSANERHRRKRCQRTGKIGLGTNDARAIAYARGENAKFDYFASHDFTDLNQHKVAIETLLPGLRIVKPTEFIAEWNARR